MDIRWINPGWDVFVAGDINWVSAILTIVETSNRSHILAETTIKNIDGSHKGLTNFHGNEVRIGTAYGRLANVYGRRMKQKDPMFKTSKF